MPEVQHRPRCWDQAVAGSKAIIDARLRYERVEQPVTAPRTQKVADALTARLRAGFETGAAWNTRLLVEGEFVDEWVGDFNSTANGRTQYPTVADPAAGELNRLQLTNTSLPGTTVTLGRQRINLDDQRFVGNVGWRQNEQTYDALRVVNTSISKLTVDLTYVDRVNRVFGENSLTQLPTFRGDMVLANLAYQLPFGKLTGFGYLLDLSNNAAGSSATAGLRFAGQKPVGAFKLNYTASWARQEDHGNNPIDYRATYLFGELGLGRGGFTTTLGYERLGAGARSFATPLATLHKFQGWADVFLTTPANGIEDGYASLAYAARRGPFDSLGVSGVFHQFDAARDGADLGHEMDLLLSARVQRLAGTLKYADYSGPVASQDVSKLWFELSVAW